MSAKVSFQKNGYECGLYLLHFAQAFIGDPKKYVNVITGQSPSGTTKCIELWHVGQDFETNQRKELLSTIEALLVSGLLKLHDPSEEDNEDDEDEIEIVETEPQAMDF